MTADAIPAGGPSTYPGRVFGRSKSDQAPAPTDSATQVKTGGKGRPTPKRREVEASNKKPVVGGQRTTGLVGGMKTGGTKEEQKAAKAARRQADRESRAKARVGLLNGEERFLTARDSGPARRWVRDYIDSRWNFGEIAIVLGMGVAGFALVIGFLGRPGLTVWVSYLLYPLIAITVVDFFIVRRRVQRLAAERFGDKASGCGTYGAMRALQIRRSRVPKPQVNRGQPPR
jgi:hypothetical protein